MSGCGGIRRTRPALMVHAALRIHFDSGPATLTRTSNSQLSGCGFLWSVPSYATSGPFLLAAAALGLRLLLSPCLHDLIPFATFFIPITVSAVLGGIIPGLM